MRTLVFMLLCLTITLAVALAQPIPQVINGIEVTVVDERAQVRKGGELNIASGRTQAEVRSEYNYRIFGGSDRGDAAFSCRGKVTLRSEHNGCGGENHPHKQSSCEGSNTNPSTARLRSSAGCGNKSLTQTAKRSRRKYHKSSERGQSSSNELKREVRRLTAKETELKNRINAVEDKLKGPRKQSQVASTCADALLLEQMRKYAAEAVSAANKATEAANQADANASGVKSSVGEAKRNSKVAIAIAILVLVLAVGLDRLHWWNASHRLCTVCGHNYHGTRNCRVDSCICGFEPEPLDVDINNHGGG